VIPRFRYHGVSRYSLPSLNFPLVLAVGSFRALEKGESCPSLARSIDESILPVVSSLLADTTDSINARIASRYRKRGQFMTNTWSPADNPHKGSRAIRAERELEHSPASAWVRAIVCPFFAPRSLAAKMEISRLARGSSLTSRGPTWARRARKKRAGARTRACNASLDSSADLRTDFTYCRRPAAL